MAVEAHQNALKRLNTRRELEVAHARLNALKVSPAASMDPFNVVSSFYQPKQQNAPPGDAALSFFNS